jgi:hypothetical protein
LKGTNLFTGSCLNLIQFGGRRGHFLAQKLGFCFFGDVGSLKAVIHLRMVGGEHHVWLREGHCVTDSVLPVEEVKLGSMVVLVNEVPN